MLRLEALQAAVSDRTRVLFVMNPAIPSGWVANDEEWAAITGICREREIMLLYWMLWEAVVFGGRPIVVPSGVDGMRDLTVTAGAVSLEAADIMTRPDEAAELSLGIGYPWRGEFVVSARRARHEPGGSAI